MMQNAPSPEYESRLRGILDSYDWAALREFARSENQVPDEIYEKDQHFWEVMMHKLICNRLDMLAKHESSRAWLAEHGYTTDIGGF
ncbi:MAG: hypothetical protein JO322_09050 [Candidatus Eremiobacteraeota bacterium]|nr:hypothetical protein [Candidatus Eremiobacteraeota bacterium]